MNGYKKLKECTDELLGQETDPNDDPDILVTGGRFVLGAISDGRRSSTGVGVVL